jgi:pre-rRNA-processing protein IPI1
MFGECGGARGFWPARAMLTLRVCLQIHDSPSPVLPFFIPLTSPVRPLLIQWLESLPRCLWETGNKDHLSSATILRFLLHTAQRSGSGLFDAKALQAVTQRLAPFFHINHPTKGTILGPWKRLGSRDLRWLCLDVACVMVSGDGADALAIAVEAAVRVVGGEDQARWTALSTSRSLE